MIKIIVSKLRDRASKRREYHRLIAEIESLNTRDLQDLRADPSEMKRVAYADIYGATAS